MCILNSSGSPVANPVSFKYTPSTKLPQNVNITKNSSAVFYNVTDAQVKNRVNLTCVTGNGFAMATLDYMAYVGGE